MPTVAQYLVNKLLAAGVKRVYGLPGGENVTILEALRQGGIEFLLVKNESSACYMAATEARLSGSIGVALATLGPGAANACAGLAHAYLDRAPVLLITAASDPARRGRHTHQVLDLNAVFAPISKYTAELRAGSAAMRIDSALALAKAARPGPVHLALHNAIAGQELGRFPASAGVKLPASAASKELPKLEEMRQLLAAARKPIIQVGLGLEPERPYAELRAFAEALGAPVIDTPKSKGALPQRHPLFAGTIGLTRADPAYALLDEADLILALGFDVVELVKPWGYQKPLLWIANWANQDPRIECTIERVGGIGALLKQLMPLAAPADDAWGEARVKQFRAGRSVELLPKPEPRRILPSTFLRSLRANSADDLLVTTDVGSHKIFAALEWAAQLPNRYFVSNGLSAMGFGLSSAIAAALVSKRHVACITGDAGLAMVMGELGLLAERELPLLLAVMNDSALDLIRSAQRRQGAPAFGTEFLNPDYENIAAAYALEYRIADSRASCDSAIRHWQRSGKALLLDVRIDPIGYPTTPRSG